MKKSLLVTFILSAGAALSPCLAVDYYGNGYTIVSGDDLKAGNDLDVIVYKSIQAHSVQNGLIELLDGSGWRLADLSSSDPGIHRLYLQTYPDFKRTINPTSLGSALQYIAGDAWDLVVDPVNKLISFQLAANYRCFTLSEAVCSVPRPAQ